MSVFDPGEIEYMASQRHGRLATVDAAGKPHVVPVAFRYDAEADAIDVSGPIITRTKKYRDVQASGRAAFVVDDLLPPWRPRGIEIRGTARILEQGGNKIHEGFAPQVIRITPERIAVWGVQGQDIRSSRSVKPSADDGAKA